MVKVVTCYRQRDRDVECKLKFCKIADENLRMAKLKIEHRVWKRIQDKRESEKKENCQEQE